VSDRPPTRRESPLGFPAGGIASASPWLPFAPPARLEAPEVDVWRAALDHGPACDEELRRLLAPDECDRAARFHFEQDRRRFVAGRGLLRVILSSYLGITPHALRFNYGCKGKPALAMGGGDGRLRFNVSHSAGLALIAVTLDRELGIDVERIDPALPEDIAERFFSPSEVAKLRAIPPERQRDAFFACWTRKEAYLKAKGDGLAVRLDRFDVSLAPGEPAALLETRGDPAEASRWSLAELDPAPGYAAAIAIEGRGCRLRRWHWPQRCLDEADVVTCAVSSTLRPASLGSWPEGSR
jgi:4'-phosphopantetheinyl transferase